MGGRRGGCARRLPETRDRLSERLFATTDAIASLTWDLDEIPTLLRQLSEAMSDEVTWLSELEPIGAAA